MEPNRQLLGEFKHITRSVWAADGTLDHVEVLLPGAPEGVTVHAPSLEVFMSWLAYVIHLGSGGQVNPLLVAPPERKIATEGAPEPAGLPGDEGSAWPTSLGEVAGWLSWHPRVTIADVMAEYDLDDIEATSLLERVAEWQREHRSRELDWGDGGERR